MGGEIGVESKEGEGSMFWVDLNAAAGPVVSKARARKMKARAGKLPVDTLQRTLLYVEDNPANLMLVEDLIARRPDLRLLSARDGKSGIEIARAEAPDVILMDINLPGISGITALGILARDPMTSDIPVIAVSANAMPRDITKGLEAGFFAYLTKPIKLGDFTTTLDAALARADGKSPRSEPGAAK
jgi:CheY-like chemotaxis protein